MNIGWQCLILFFFLSAPLVFWLYEMTRREKEKDAFEECQERSDKWGLL